MAFLDNSGDIILDAVLTDTGRYRLAKGDGSFKIVKYALGDDEINYGLYNKTHPSGSAYYDLEILQTPILEAFTNNTATMKSKLISIPRTNLKYLPVLEANPESTFAKYDGGSFSGPWVVAVDLATAGDGSQENALIQNRKSGDTSVNGILNGYSPGPGGNSIRIDQGLDTLALSKTNVIDADLNETQYIVELDNRFGSIVETDGTATNVSFIDDDNIASYFFSFPSNIVKNLTSAVDSPIDGPRGTLINFKIRASNDLATSTYLFEQLGSSGLTIVGNKGATLTNARYIDSTVKITGATTGYSIDIPIRFVKASG